MAAAYILTQAHHVKNCQDVSNTETVPIIDAARTFSQFHSMAMTTALCLALDGGAGVQELLSHQPSRAPASHHRHHHGRPRQPARRHIATQAFPPAPRTQTLTTHLLATTESSTITIVIYALGASYGWTELSPRWLSTLNCTPPPTIPREPDPLSASSPNLRAP